MANTLTFKADLGIHFKVAVEHNKFQEFVDKSQSIISHLQESEQKTIVELTIREVLIEMIMLKTDIPLLERVFNFSFEAALFDIAPGSLPALLLGDMFDSCTIVECEKIFTFVENKVETFKKDIFFKMCKNQLLRSCNDLLRRLSRSQNTVFCGRILLFLAHIFPLSERSGLNIISEFNFENATVYSTSEDILSDIASEKGDTAEEGEIDSSNQSPIVTDKNLYQKFWSLQDFFHSPNTCYNKIQWRHFASCTSEVLAVFGSFKCDDANSSKWKQAKLPSSNGASVYFAKYLTSPKLLELELSDSHFRRYVLVQFLILFQYLTLPVKFKLEAYALTEEQQSWVKNTSKKVYELLEETPPNGVDFARDIEKILQREEFWNAWKNDGCPDFKQTTEKLDIEKKSRKRPWEDFHTYKCKSNSEATKLWSTKPNNWEACKSAKRNFVPTLESFFGIAGSKGEGASNQKIDTSESKYTWKALRLLCMKSPHFFTANPSLKTVSEYLQHVIQKMAKEKPPVQDNVMETSVTEDSIEDGNDEFLPASEDDSKEEVKSKKEILFTKSLIEAISGKLQDHWQTLAVQLGFLDEEIEYYEESFAKSKIQAQQMLTVWTERDGTLPVFLTALEKANLSSSITTYITGLLPQE